VPVDAIGVKSANRSWAGGSHQPGIAAVMNLLPACAAYRVLPFGEVRERPAPEPADVL